MSPSPCRSTPSASINWLAQAEYQEVPLDAIDLSDLTFKWRSDYEAPALAEAIKSWGLLQPLLLRRQREGKLQLVCGWRRFLCLQRLGWPAVPALILPPETPDRWCRLAILADQPGPVLNLVEVARLVQLLAPDYSPEEMCRNILPRLGQPGTKAQLQALQAVLQLEPAYQELLAAGRLTLATAARLAAWEAADREALLPWWRVLALSQSYQRELLEFFTTLSRRSGQPIRHWLQQPEVQEILATPNLSGNDRRQRLWDRLRRWCFPRLSAVQDQFQRCLARLGLKDRPDLRLEPPPAFEGEEFRLELRCRNRQELARLVAELHQLLTNPALEEVFKL